MSIDDRISALTDSVAQHLRGPLESSLRQVLTEVMTAATEERSSAIAAALAEAAASHDQALAAVCAQATKEKGDALQALREDLTREWDDALAGVRAQAEAERDQAVQALRESLGRDHEDALSAARAQADAARETAARGLVDEHSAREAAALEDLRARLTADHEAALAALRTELAAEREQALAALRDETAGERDQVLAALRDELTRDHEAVLAASRDQATADLDHAIAEARAAGAAAGAATLVVAHQERDAARTSAAELAEQLATIRAEREQLRQLADAESQAAEEREEDGAVEARAGERHAELACSERLLDAVRHLDTAASLTDVLSALADHASSEVGRVAVLIVQGGHLRGWRLTGMGEAQPAGLDLPIERAGLLGRAVATARPASTDDGTDIAGDALPAFLTPPAGRLGLAVPVVVGGRVVAVLYGDDGGKQETSAPSNWPELVEVLARHSGRCLEVLTLSRAAATTVRAAQEARQPGSRPVPDGRREADEAQEDESARRYARLLISEIKLYNETAVADARRDGNLLALLRTEIDRARRLYEEKIPIAVRQRVDCFDEEIVRTLAGGDRAVLGQVT